MRAIMNPGTSKRAFVRHILEMFVAMVAGIAILGVAVSLLLISLGCASLLDDHVDHHAAMMATNTTVGMGLWMRHRGHTRMHIREMAWAMYVPFLIPLVLH
jgi:hypothetical protein